MIPNLDADSSKRFRDREPEPSVPEMDALTALRQIAAQTKALDQTLLLNLRQAVMRYTNPLRTKILLFCLLYPSDQNLSKLKEQAFLLKGYELDQLLEQTLQTYNQFAVLAMQIKNTAHRLDRPLEYRQTAAGILRAVKPFYSASTAQQSPPPQNWTRKNTEAQPSEIHKKVSNSIASQPQS